MMFRSKHQKKAIFLAEKQWFSVPGIRKNNIPLGKAYFFAFHTSKWQYSLRKTIVFDTPYVKMLIFLREKHTFLQSIRQNVNIRKENHTFWYPDCENVNIPMGKPYFFALHTWKWQYFITTTMVFCKSIRQNPSIWA